MNNINPQSWSNCNVETKQYINRFIELLKNNLNNNLVGIYLHGSLAMNSYFSPKSDIDIIAVVDNKLKPFLAKSLNLSIVKYSNERGNIEDIEFSIITKDTAKNIPNKMPYELHYSVSQKEKILNDQINYDIEHYDNDLFSHLMYIKKRGICLYGQVIDEVFGNVEWKMFMFSIFEDLDDILEDIDKSPIYGILNICRVLKLLENKERSIQSKYEGGIWGIENMPNEYEQLIEKALENYCSNEIKTEKIVYNKNDLRNLCEYVKKKKGEYLENSIK
jgi:streptomycin 3"-adenylyltransferase